MSEHQPIIERLLAGREYDLKKIDDEIDLWHEGASLLSLHKWLGFTREEYELFVEKPQSVRLILAARHQKVPLRSLLTNTRPSEKLAARGASQEELEELRRWLIATKRM